MRRPGLSLLTALVLALPAAPGAAQDAPATPSGEAPDEEGEPTLTVGVRYGTVASVGPIPEAEGEPGVLAEDPQRREGQVDAGPPRPPEERPLRLVTVTTPEGEVQVLTRVEVDQGACVAVRQIGDTASLSPTEAAWCQPGGPPPSATAPAFEPEEQGDEDTEGMARRSAPTVPGLPPEETVPEPPPAEPLPGAPEEEAAPPEEAPGEAWGPDEEAPLPEEVGPTEEAPLPAEEGGGAALETAPPEAPEAVPPEGDESVDEAAPGADAVGPEACEAARQALLDATTPAEATQARMRILQACR